MGINNIDALKPDDTPEERVPTEADIKAANECPSCDAFGLCPSHKWIHEYLNYRRKNERTQNED